jgi:sugar lactone lactonase YvrE
VSGLAITGATLGGTVVNDGGSGTITERGVVYALTSQNSNPQIGGSGVTKLTVAGTTGTFSRGLSGLTASSAYTFTVYATNANGTVYSSAVNFTTLGTNAAPGIFYDIPAVLRPSVAVSYAPVQIGSAVPDGPYLQVTNFAGSGTAGETDATGTSATFKQPTGATVDAAGNVYVADNGNHKIRKITPQGVVTTLAGDGYEFFYVGRLKNANGTAASFNYPTDLAVDPAAQFLYVADKLNDVIRRVSLTSPYPVTTFAGSGTGGMLDSATASTARFSDPEGIAVDPTGTYLYVADRKNHRIRQITIATAAVTTLAGSGSAGTADHANPLSATFDEPTGIAVDAAGHVYVTDFGGNKVRKIAVTAGVAGAVTSLGGSATFSGPYGVDVDGAGNVYVTEQTGHLIRMISASGSVSTLAGVSGTAGSSEGIGLAATFNQPSGITIHPNGVAYITHYDNAATGNKIRKINLAGYRLTGSLPAGLSFNAATGAISGSPIGLQAASAFSVSVFNYTGSGNTALSVAVGLEPVFPAADTLVLEVGGFAASGVLGALQLGFVPGPKQLLTLVNNTGSSLVSGTFTGLPEGAVLTTTVAGDTFYFKISYKGGTGNDITLTRSAGPGQVDAPFESGAFPPYLALRTVSALATNSATVSATFKPNGLMTTVHVEYGLTTDYGSSVPVTPANPSNTTEQVVSAVLGGLAQGSNYFYRFTATNVDGTTVTPGGNFYTRSVPVEIPATTRLASGTTLDIDIQVANQVVKVVCVGQVYTFTLSGGATNTWAGSAAGTSASGATLTVTPGSTYNTIHITDSAAGAAVTFNTSGNNFYADQFNVTLNDSPGAVTFNGSSAFSGSNGLNILTTRNIAFASGSSLSLIDGNLSLDANTQTPATSMTVSGIEINGATVQTIGSGSTTLRARGGTGAAASFLNKGIAILSGGSLVGGTTGTMIIEGRGFAGVNGPIQGQGVFVSGRHSTTLAVSTITSGGADVSVTGYGAENTDPAIANAACNEGVAVGNAASASGTWYGKITSGGDGAVTVTGYGGTVVAPASASSIHCSGVYVLGSDAMITSGGAGKVTVSGTAGGPASNSQYCMGVGLFGTTNGGILGGPGASVEVIGRGSEVAGSGCSYNYGVSVMLGRIKAGVGAGTTRVTGYGGGTGAADTGEGISLAGRNGVATYPSITSDGSGSVTVIGHGANASGNVNRGIDLSAWASISSGGGDVRVEGNGGGMGTSPTNFGLNLTTGSYITAGGMGNVTVIGRGGSNLSATAGGTNHGVNVDSGGINQTPGYITSSGGSVTVEGYGGGGSADFLSASSSSTNYGVFVNQGGYITAGGSGAVSITGQGGNLSPGASGSTNVGVLVSSANGTSGNLYSYITSGGGAVTVNGTGGGSQTAAGSSGSNHGVQVKIGGTITAGGTGTVSVTGTGGNPSATGNGATNHGVNVDGTTTLARITSNNGNVTVTGTGGSQGSGASNHGIYLNAGGKVSSDGSAATVSLSGTGGNSSSSGNHGVFVTGGTSPNFSTVTSGGGPVSISGNGGGRASSSSTCGVNVTSGALVTSGGGAGPVTIVGRGGMGSGSSNHGVSVATGGAAVTSGGADLSITGHEGSAGTACVALAIGSGGTVTTASNGGALSLSGNSFTLAGAVSAGSSGTVNLMPLSSGVAMNLGLATDPIGGPVAFSSTELNQVTAATINLGSTTAGNVTVSQPIAFPAGANVHVITAAGASLTPSGSGTDVTMGSGKVLDLSTISTLNLAINGTTADSGYQRLVLADSLNLTGKSLKLSGTYMPAAGNGFTIVSAAGLSGTFDGLPNGAEVVFNGIPLRIGYTATSVTLTATPVSAPPVFAGYAVTAKTGKTAAISPAKILARASDPDGGTVTLTRVFGPSAQGGTVSLTGTVNYTPAPSFTGPDSFDIELTGSGGGTLRATISVTVTADAAAGLNQTGLKLRDGMVDLTFRGIPGRVYTIQRSTNLATWTTLATVTAAADGKIIFTDPSPPQPSGYYRARY